MRCTTCKGQVRPATVELKSVVSGHTFVSNVMAGKCQSCGEIFYPGPLLEMVDLIIAATLVRHGERSGEAMRFIRKAIGISAKELAELFGMTQEHVSRLEHGKHPVSEQVMALLGSIALDQADGRSAILDTLHAMRAPTKLGKRVPIEVPAKKWMA